MEVQPDPKRLTKIVFYTTTFIAVSLWMIFTGMLAVSLAQSNGFAPDLSAAFFGYVIILIGIIATPAINRWYITKQFPGVTLDKPARTRIRVFSLMLVIGEVVLLFPLVALLWSFIRNY